MPVRVAALEAGARLADERAAEALVQIASHQDPQLRVKAAQLLAHLPRSLKAARTLYDLIDDADQSVRLAAYNGLAENNDPILRRTPVGESNRPPKFILDLVPAERPLIYVVQDEYPRIAVFNLRTPFQTPLLARLWNDRLMLKADEPDTPIDVFYQPAGGGPARTFRIAPTVSNLVRLLAHKPDAQLPFEGLDLSYSHVVNALYQLSNDKHLPCGVIVRRSTLAAAVSNFRDRSPGLDRPETGPPTMPQDPSTTGVTGAAGSPINIQSPQDDSKGAKRDPTDPTAPTGPRTEVQDES
jgi:hypothetical protein